MLNYKYCFVIASMAASLALASPWLVAGREEHHLPRLAAATDRGPAVPEIASSRKRAPLDCRVVPVGQAERMNHLKEWSRLRTRPDLITPRLCRNSLMRDGIYANVEVKNTSGVPLAIFSSDKFPFWVSPRIEDAAGRPISFEKPGIRSLKRLNVVNPGTPIVTLEPGRVLAEGFSIFAYMPFDTDIKPGRYSVRAICSYFRASDGADCQVESKPFFVTITEDNIREWRALFELDQELGDGQVEESSVAPR